MEIFGLKHNNRKSFAKALAKNCKLSEKNSDAMLTKYPTSEQVKYLVEMVKNGIQRLKLRIVRIQNTQVDVGKLIDDYPENVHIIFNELEKHLLLSNKSFQN